MGPGTSQGPKIPHKASAQDGLRVGTATGAIEAPPFLQKSVT